MDTEPNNSSSKETAFSEAERALARSCILETWRLLDEDELLLRVECRVENIDLLREKLSAPSVTLSLKEMEQTYGCIYCAMEKVGRWEFPTLTGFEKENALLLANKLEEEMHLLFRLLNL